MHVVNIGNDLEGSRAAHYSSASAHTQWRLGRMGTMIFHSKTDAWLLIVLVAASAVAVLSGGTLLVVTGGAGAWLLAIAIVLLGAGLPLWVLLSTRYTLTASELSVASGPFAW